MTQETANFLADLCYFMAAISACVAVGGWVGYRNIQQNRKDNE